MGTCGVEMSMCERVEYCIGKSVCERVTAGYFYDTFAYEICFYGIYFYGIYIYGIYFYRALKFMSINCTVVRKHKNASIHKRKIKNGN